MTALEQEIIEKFHQLDHAAQQRVRAAITGDTIVLAPSNHDFDFDAWWAEVKALQFEILQNTTGHRLTATDLLNEVREERDADILRGIGLGDTADDSTD